MCCGTTSTQRTVSEPRLADNAVGISRPHAGTRRCRVGQWVHVVRVRSRGGSPCEAEPCPYRQDQRSNDKNNAPTLEWSVACSMAILVTSSHRVQLHGRNPGSAAPAGDGRRYIPVMHTPPSTTSRVTHRIPPPSLLPPLSGSPTRKLYVWWGLLRPVGARTGPSKLCYSLVGGSSVARAVKKACT